MTMREYLTRAGIIGRNDTFGESTRDRRQNEPTKKNPLGDNFNSTLTVRI